MMETNVVRNIVNEIIRECYPRQIQANEQFVAYMVGLLLLDPNWNITEDFLTSRSYVQKLVIYVVNQLQNGDSMMMTILKKQFFFKVYTEHLHKMLHQKKEKLYNKLAPIRNTIVQKEVPSNDSEMEALIRYMVIYVVFLTALGNPMEHDVFLEGKQAFKSIMNENEIKEFCTYSEKEKAVRLNELSKIICGIRLFNKYCNKGGAGIPELSVLFKRAAHVVIQDLKFIQSNLQINITKLTQFFKKYYVLKENGSYLELILTTNLNENTVETYKDMLVYFKQWELFIKKLQHYVDVLFKKNLKTDIEMRRTLQNIYESVHGYLTVPVVIIYPKFVHLSKLWMELQDQVLILSRYNKIFTNLASKPVHLDLEVLEELINSDITALKGVYYETDDETCLCRTKNLNICKFNANIELQYLGFCCWAFVETDGALIPGNYQLGIAIYNNMYFAFSSLYAYSNFVQNADNIVNRVLEIARKKPHLIGFFSLNDQLAAVSKIKELVKKSKIKKNLVTQAVQTAVVHPKPSSPRRSTWYYKQEALKISNLLHCRSVAVQTTKTSSTSCMGSMSWPNKNASSQTKCDKSVGTSPPSLHILGFRSKRDNNQYTIDVTLPGKYSY